MRHFTAAMALLVATALGSARAEVRVDAGLAKGYDGEEATVAGLAWLSDQRHPWEVMLGYIAERERADIPNANFLALSKRFYWRGWFASGGVAWVSVDNEVLSGHGQFMTGVGHDFGRLTLSLRHLSNGSTSGRNHGETFALLEVAF